MDNKLIFENWRAFRESERQSVQQEVFGGLFGKAPKPSGPTPKGLAQKLTGATGGHDRAYEQLEKDLEEIFAQPGKCFFTHTVLSQSGTEKSIEQNGIYWTKPEYGEKLEPFLVPIGGSQPKQMTAFLRDSNITRDPDATTFIVALPGGSCPSAAYKDGFLSKAFWSSQQAMDIEKIAFQHSEPVPGVPIPRTNHWPENRGLEAEPRRIPPKYIVGIIKNGQLKKA